MLLLAGPARAQEKVLAIHGAVEQLIETYRQAKFAADQGMEPEPELLKTRARAIELIAQGGPLSSTPLREALQQENLPAGAGYIMGTMLMLTDGATAGDFVLAQLKERDPAEDPVEAFRLGHTLMLTAPHHGAIFAERLAELTNDIRFPVPNEGIAFPLIGGIAWLYAAGDTDALNDLAALIEDVSRLPPHVSDNLLRVVTQLQLHQLLPLIEEQAASTPEDSPRFRALLWALGQLDDPKVIPQLDKFRRTLKDPILRQEATFALGEIQSPAALGPLRDALSDKIPGVRSYAVSGLVKLDTPKARTLIREALGGPESDQQVQADYLRAARQAGDRTWRDALAKAAENWPKHKLIAKETSLSLARTEPRNPAAPPPSVWPGEPMNELPPERLNEQLWDVINARGLGFSQMKKTVLYSATPKHIQHLEYLRTLLARELTRQNLDTWLDVLNTLQLVRRRLRDDPRPLFAPRGSPSP